MRKTRLYKILLTGIIAAGIYSCTKSADDFTGNGGGLITHYILAKDSSFSPTVLTLQMGNSITFVNDTENEHSIVSDDSSTILSGVILPHNSYYFRKDTVGTIRYHCGKHPSVKGVIYLNP